jgi:hypothetical protein
MIALESVRPIPVQILTVLEGRLVVAQAAAARSRGDGGQVPAGAEQRQLDGRGIEPSRRNVEVVVSCVPREAAAFQATE